MSLRTLLQRLWRPGTPAADADPERRHALVGRPQLWQMKREFQVRFLRERGLEPHHRLVDIGCGTLRGGLPLIAYLEPGHYCGIEVREEALIEARRELREASLEDRRPELILCPDIGQLRLEQRFDFAWAFSVFIHMDDRIFDAALGFVREHLAPSGVCYGNVIIGPPDEKRWREFPVVSRPLAFYEAACRARGLDLEALGPLRVHGHVSQRTFQDETEMLCITPVSSGDSDPASAS